MSRTVAFAYWASTDLVLMSVIELLILTDLEVLMTLGLSKYYKLK